MRVCLLTALALLVAVSAGVSMLVRKIPFGRSAVIADIERRTGARVEIGRFQQEWLPPSLRAESIRITDQDGDVMTVASVFITSSYTGMLHSIKSVRTIEARGLQLTIPPRPGGAKRKVPDFLIGHGNDPLVRVEEIRITDGRLEIPSMSESSAGLVFAVKQLKLEHVGQNRPTTYQVVLQNPMPPGEIRSVGEFGPVDLGKLDQVPISGWFTYQHADLTIPGAIKGTLNGSGKFSGSFGQLRCLGNADIPDFQVAVSSHPVHVSTQFDLTVDARTGDSKLNEVIAHFNRTTVLANGDVVGAPERGGKVVTVNTEVQNGRVEDILTLFTMKPNPAMDGAIRLKSRFTIPPGPPGFLERIGIAGTFAISGSRLTNDKAQTAIDRLSASAAGKPKRELTENARLASAEIRASVLGSDGLAHLRNITFEAPGVHGRLEGTFKLHGTDVNLNGTLQTTGKLSDTTSGVKSLLLKVLSPGWRKHEKMKSFPFHITGKTSHPIFRMRVEG